MIKPALKYSSQIFLSILCAFYLSGRVVIGEQPSTRITPETMAQIYDEVKTPHKYGIVLEGKEGTLVDSPSVFRNENRWYMVYIVFTTEGYETMLAGYPVKSAYV